MNRNDSLRDQSLPARNSVARRLIVFLHGYGADGNDLLSLGRSLTAVLPDCAFAAPDAPFACEAGYGHQWFSLRDWSPQGLKTGVASALPILDAYLDRQRAHWKLEDGNIYLVGFSQGTMMALAAALSRDRQIGGVIGYSGVYIEPETVRTMPPVLLVHGTADTVVPFPLMADSANRLRLQGIEVQTMSITDLGHGIDPQGIEAGLAFLARRDTAR